ncbi:DUF2807 domain-containing protein [Myroides ceti]|uniref:DUF2807 domain-containing protein n=1 Tax=Paenimyroides ceti TaxID=395087 RepID=A0ABT8CZH4_9FLAO|nr:DUF2807 domain-containing protein [Paenimyroides ceti]MDN3709456.1 DUF2807 domain-containing protein [Paenimyroides ceti]
MKKLLHLMLPSILLVVISCNSKNNRNNSPTEIIIYKMQSFENIVNKSFANIEISDEVPEDEIHLIGSKRLIESLNKTVDINTLYLENSRGIVNIDNADYLVVKINHSHLKSIILDGIGSIKGMKDQTSPVLRIKVNVTGSIELPLNNENTDIVIDGIGSITLTGKTNHLSTKINGTGNLNAEELQSNTSLNDISGIGNASIWSTQKINVTITGIGNLEYKPNLTSSLPLLLTA